jgi:hypothetical protein
VRFPDTRTKTAWPKKSLEKRLFAENSSANAGILAAKCKMFAVQTGAITLEPIRKSMHSFGNIHKKVIK